MVFKRATMDFFGAQDLRRKTTAILVVHFFLAVLITGIATYLVVILYWKGWNAVANFYRAQYHRPLVTVEWWDPVRFAIVAGSIASFMFLATAWKIIQLLRPVEYVMRLVGASRVTSGIKHPPTRQFISIVEEMAIASGLPVPDTYVMTHAEGINALAVGLSPGAAAVAVTNGAINMLSRDELQGVVAHEFSHILNGDMVINVRLVGVLYGVDCIGLAGRLMVKALLLAARSGVPGHDNVAAAVAWLGYFLSLPFLVISYVGLVMGGLIRAAISRQREYLADAAAVQFTRHPESIAGALKKIGGLAAGSMVGGGPNAGLASHFFFANSLAARAVGQWIGSTHPPLARRVRKIDPSFDGKFAPVPVYYKAEMGSVEAADWLPKRETPADVARKSVMTSTGISVEPQTFPEMLVVDPDEILEMVGAPKAVHLEHVGRLMAGVSPVVLGAARELAGAQALLYGMLLGADAGVREAQRKHLAAQADPDVLRRLDALEGPAQVLEPEVRIPLVDIAIGTLRDLASESFARFESNLLALIAADSKEDLFEFVVRKVVTHHLTPLFRRQKHGMLFYNSMASVRAEAMLLVACISSWEASQSKDAGRAYERGLEKLGIKAGSAKPAACDIGELDAALEKISLAKPFVKKQVLASCAACVISDGRISVLEAEMLRAIADSLKCPLPPIVTGAVRKAA